MAAMLILMEIYCSDCQRILKEQGYEDQRFKF